MDINDIAENLGRLADRAQGQDIRAVFFGFSRDMFIRVLREAQKLVEGANGMPPHEFTDKERLLNFVKKIIPDDFECKHFSMTFTEDGDALIHLSNREENEDDE